MVVLDNVRKELISFKENAFYEGFWVIVPLCLKVILHSKQKLLMDELIRNTMTVRCLLIEPLQWNNNITMNVNTSCKTMAHISFQFEEHKLYLSVISELILFTVC